MSDACWALQSPLNFMFSACQMGMHWLTNLRLFIWLRDTCYKSCATLYQDASSLLGKQRDHWSVVLLQICTIPDRLRREPD